MSSNNDWKLPLNLAIGFHILVALSTILFPMVFKSKPEFVDIYSVNLVNMEEPAAPAAPAPAPAPAPAKTQSQPPPAAPPKVIEKTAAPVKIPPKAAVPVAAEKPAEVVQPAEVAPPAPPKAVSLTPIKRKVKKEVPPDDTVQREAERREQEIEKQKRNREIEKQTRQQLAESLRAEQIAAEEAQLAAEAAEAERNRMEQTRQRLSQIRSSVQGSASSTTSSTSTSSSPAATQGGGSTSALDAQYYAAVAARIQPFFQLPEIKTFDPALLTVVIITISKSGEVADTQIESSSGDALYDQFVIKSIEAANPLPPIPPALRKQRIEMGLKFSPGGIH
ncbi:TonB C-terminal domain-containing protein [Desulfoprunum benzoelyticum]|uniref:Colicin import membrane protein n=1 Tax=Desulfoprunum benzoelyticum TaxID=1506996 RepID=A0A840UP99_9BACT|nr:energy transducer TonB [Desulfoprunum benzoelyticum]MBB5346383.1 colicin import membrane protein [Desulfoprunum benzoelyticum]MBM9528618.1 TonB C-terminal domain-containing protein [Desulfoprunum benzoelyticum]